MTDFVSEDIEERYTAFEELILANFSTFNREVIARMARYISADGVVNYSGMQLEYRRLAEQFAAGLNNVMILGSNLTAKEASKLSGENFVFNPASPAAIATFTELSQRVVGMLVQQQAEAIVEMQRIARQIEPIRSMSYIRQGLTLTGRQVRAVDNFRRMLEEGSAEAMTRQLRDKRFDPTLRRAIAGEITLTKDQIDKMVLRYIARQINFRARTISTTEATRIANEADNLFWRQAVESEQVELRQVERMWVTSLDEKVRPSHRHASGQIRALEEPFKTGDGNSLRFPGDPRAPASDTINCRCWVRTKYVELYELGDTRAAAA